MDRGLLNPLDALKITWGRGYAVGWLLSRITGIIVSGKHAKKRFCVNYCSKSSVSLLSFAFMRVAIVANSPDNKTRQLIHQPSSFHLETEDMHFLCQSISCLGVFHNLIPRSN